MMTLCLFVFILVCFFCGFFVIGTKLKINRSSRLITRTSKCSLIIPARNESENLKHLLASIKNEPHPPEQIIVVNDNSTDNTAEVAEQLGATVVHALPLPQGWTGKNWACHQGAQNAAFDVLFFLDADCVFEPSGFSMALEEFDLQSKKAHIAVSFLPYHSIIKFYEQFSIFFNLMMSAGTKNLVGQSLIIRKSDYLKSGGHESVKNQVLENFFMTKNIHDSGVQTKTYLGQGVLSVRMFPRGMAQLIEGWTKAFSRGAKHTHPKSLVASIFWLFGFATVVTAFLMSHLVGEPLATQIKNLMPVCYVIFALQLYFLSRKLGNFSPIICALYPLAWIFYQTVFARSLYLKPHQKTWKGRTL